MDLHRKIGGGARIHAGIEFDAAGQVDVEPEHRTGTEQELGQPTRRLMRRRWALALKPTSLPHGSIHQPFPSWHGSSRPPIVYGGAQRGILLATELKKAFRFV